MNFNDPRNFWELALMAFVLGCLLGLLALQVWKWFVARRAAKAEEQLAQHIRMRHGFHYAKRMGWLDKLLNTTRDL